MTYKPNLWKLIFSPFDQLFQLNKAEKVKQLYALSFLFILLSITLYGWMGWLGIGSDILSPGAVSLAREEYEAAKFSFLEGRILYGLLFSLFLLLVPSLLFCLLFRIAFSKTVLLQLAVLALFLVERLLWVPLYVYFGLDWYASPFSFGPAASVLTDIPFLIYLGGSVTLFHIWITGFQIYYLSSLTKIKKRWVWVTVIVLHLFYITAAALVTYYAPGLIDLFSRGD